MRRKIPLWTVVCMSAFLVSTSWAQAPPVNQNIGMADVAIAALAEADCRVCHASGVPDRHHNLYGDPIPGGSLVPYPDADGDAVPDTVYACLNCHATDFSVERDCTVCHTSSGHHTTPTATSGDCVACHGDLVDNFDDGHYVPSYATSLVTPSRNLGDGDPANSRGNLAGACDYCHDDDGLPTPVILTSMALHHAASSDCAACHVGGSASTGTDGEKMRQCESCHGPESLHNIQADSNGGGIVVGGEDAGYGHVGRDAGPSDSDCWGCHGFAGVGLALPPAPTVPSLSSVNRQVVYAGEDTLVVLNGASLTNTAGGVFFESNAVLTAADGSSVTLARASVDNKALVVTIPGNTAAGNYKLRAVKNGTDGDPVASNSIAIQVIPRVSITNVKVADGIVTISGSGFSGYAAGSDTSVTGRTGTTTAKAKIVSWSDTVIKAKFGDASPEAITVKSVFGTDTYPD